MHCIEDVTQCQFYRIEGYNTICLDKCDSTEYAY